MQGQGRGDPKVAKMTDFKVYNYQRWSED